jgi:putative DNA methylase
MTYKKKLIEVALPLGAISEASSKEKSIRQGNISTMHLWWSRKPLAACKAVLFASLVDDPGNSLPPKEAEKERKRLFRIIEELVKWDNPKEKEILKKVQEEIVKSTDNNPPPVLDPFCGGGSIPLAAQMIGLDSYGIDLNPVAVLISKGLVEIPPKFIRMPPINPDSQKTKLKGEWTGTKGLAEDIRYYGKWVREEANKKIGYMYPLGPNNETVVAWLWCRTVTCPNPACQLPVPLVSKWEVSKKENKERWVKPIIDKSKKSLHFIIQSGQPTIKPTKTGKVKFNCLDCNSLINDKYIKERGGKNEIQYTPMCLVTEGKSGLNFYDSNYSQQTYIKPITELNGLDILLPNAPRYISPPLFGYTRFCDLFLDRQLLALTTFSELVKNLDDKILEDYRKSSYSNRNSKLEKEYTNAIKTYLAFSTDRCADYWTTLAIWAFEFVAHTFGRQAIPISWDFAEINPFSTSTGNWMGAVEWVAKVVQEFDYSNKGQIKNLDSTTTLDFDGIYPLISTDPPYYDMVSYSDLADFFYIWLRNSLRDTYPDLFSTVVTPKSKELVADSSAFDEDLETSKKRFLEGLERSFHLIKNKMNINYPLTVYYAYKQSEDENYEGDIRISSSGWETMLSGLISSEFQIVGTWPIKTERSARPRSINSNALTSSIVIVCRPRSSDSPIATRRDFINILKKELPSALKNLQAAGIAPVDLAQASIGPSMAVFSRYSKVLESDGNLMTVRTALQIINQELDSFLAEQESDMDKETRFCVSWFEQYGYNTGPFGDANTLATAKGTAINTLEADGLVYAKAGKVRLLMRSELKDDWNPTTDKKLTVWECIQYSIKALELEGEKSASEILRKIGGLSDPVKELSYRLYSLCEKKGWTEDALAYNSLISSWQSITDQAQFAESDSEKKKKAIKDKAQKRLIDT